MSDQTPSLGNLGAVDGRNLINVPSGGGGITTINGNGNPAQTIAGEVGVIVVSTGPPGTVNITANDFTGNIGGNVRGVVPDPGVGTNSRYLSAGGAWLEAQAPPTITRTESLADVIAGGSVNNFICHVVAPVDGFYVIVANVKFTISPATDGEAYITIYDNVAGLDLASEWKSLPFATVPNTLPPQFNCSTFIQTLAGNGFDINVVVSAAAGATTTPGLLTSLTLLYVGT